MSDISAVVKSVIDEADPMILIEMGAPDNEYEDEISAIMKRVKHTSTVDDVIEIIDDVFEASFRIVGKPDRPSLYFRQGEIWRNGAKRIIITLHQTEATEEIT